MFRGAETLGIVMDKLMVIIGEAQNVLHISWSFWNGPISNGSYHVRITFYSTLGDILLM